jgi:hypothetical protein
MPGMLGSDFDPAQPEDSDSVKFGADWIRDLKRRVKLFTSVLFNLETGQLRDRVVRHQSLADMTPPVAGTWSKVWVNSKGLVYKGENPVEQQTAQLYAAMFYAAAGGGGYVIERTGLTPLSGIAPGAGDANGIFIQNADYDGVGGVGALPPYSNLYPVRGQYSEFVWTPPVGVRRIRATVIGGGGGTYDGGGGAFFGGGGGEMVETTFTLDGTGQQALSIIVGSEGAYGSAVVNNSATKDGLPSRVSVGASIYVEAGCGVGATNSAAGGVESGYAAGNLLVVRSEGTAGGDGIGGLSGAAEAPYGRGGAGSGVTAGPGIVLLEWMG